MREQVLVALVGLLGRRVARVLAHRPAPLAVHLRVHAAGVRELPGLPQIQVLGQVRARVQRLDLDARIREATRVIGADDRRHGQVRRRVLVLDGHARQVTQGTATGVSLGRDAPPYSSSPRASRRCSSLACVRRRRLHHLDLPRPPTGGPAPTAGWTPGGDAPVTKRDRCASGGALEAGPALRPSVARQSVTWTFTAPAVDPHRRLLAVSHRHVRHGSGAWNWSLFRDIASPRRQRPTSSAAGPSPAAPGSATGRSPRRRASARRASTSPRSFAYADCNPGPVPAEHASGS